MARFKEIIGFSCVFYGVLWEFIHVCFWNGGGGGCVKHNIPCQTGAVTLIMLRSPIALHKNCTLDSICKQNVQHAKPSTTQLKYVCVVLDWWSNHHGSYDMYIDTNIVLFSLLVQKKRHLSEYKNANFVCSTLLTGSIGSLLMEQYGWTVPFYAIGENLTLLHYGWEFDPPTLWVRIWPFCTMDENLTLLCYRWEFDPPTLWVRIWPFYTMDENLTLLCYRWEFDPPTLWVRIWPSYTMGENLTLLYYGWEFDPSVL